MSHRVLSLACLTFLSLSASADVLVVDEQGGPGTFPGIQGAVYAANEGDTILVRSGTYLDFTVDGKSLTIVAEDEAEVLIGPLLQTAEHALVVRNLLPWQAVVVRGMTLYPDVLSFPEPTILLENNFGTVVLEDVHAETYGGWSSVPLYVEDSHAVIFSRCTFDTYECGFPCAAGELVNSNVTIYDSIFYGADGTAPLPFVSAGDGGAALLVSGGTVFAAGSVFEGGDGGDTADPEKCNTKAGDGIHLVDGDPSLTLRGCTVTPGQPGGGGTTDPPCEDPTGQPIVVDSGSVDALAGEARSIVVDATVREGESLMQTYEGEPGDLVFVGFAHQVMAPVFLPILAGNLALGPPFSVVSVGVIDGTGTLVNSTPITELGPGVLSVELHLQSVHLATTGGIFVSGMSSSVPLDASL